MKEYMRLESDSIGTMEVPEDAYYGVQALRAKENFPITGTRLHPVFIKNLAKNKTGSRHYQPESRKVETGNCQRHRICMQRSRLRHV